MTVGTSVCVDDKPNGQSCSQGEECASGNCPGDDGVCCDQPCNGLCEQCGDGSCDDSVQNTDPDNDCAGVDCQPGVCDTNNRCAASPVGTSCGAAPSCSGGAVTLQDMCNASGTCIDSGVDDCSPYICTGSACRTTCNFNSDCASGFNCYAPNCAPPICATPPCVLDARGYGGSLDTLATGVTLDPSSLDAFVSGTFSGVFTAGNALTSVANSQDEAA